MRSERGGATVAVTTATIAGTSCPALEGAGPGAPLRSITGRRRGGARAGARRCRGPSGQMCLKSISTAADATSRAARFSGGSETYLKAQQGDKRCCNTFFAYLPPQKQRHKKEAPDASDLRFVPTAPHGPEIALTGAAGTSGPTLDSVSTRPPGRPRSHLRDPAHALRDQAKTRYNN